IGTRRIRLIDGSQFMVPGTGVYTAKGVNMEKEGVAPDYALDPHPDDLARGIDRQLEKAVEVLEQDVVLWKKSKAGVAFSLPLAPGALPVVAPGPVPRPTPMGSETPGKKGG